MIERTEADGRTRAIAVVGSGILTAAGRGRARTLAALRSGGAGPSPPRTITTELADVHPVFEVGDDAFDGFEGRLPGGRGRRSLRLSIVAASDAVSEAIDAGIESVPSERVGVIVGATVGGMNYSEQWVEERACAARGADARRRVASRPAIRHLPLWEIPNALATRFGFRGPAFAVSTACTSGAQAIATAADLVETGVCDAVLAGGVDCLSRLTYHGFASLGVVSPRRCTPFDAGRSGLNLGEGAAFVVLLRADLAARARAGSTGFQFAGGHPVLSGWASNTDAYHMTAPRPDGSGVAAALEAALRVAGVRPDEVGWFHAHGTATPTNDAVEASAVRAVFGSRRVPVSSTKHLFGHTLGAAGAVSSVVALTALREGFVPGNAAVTAPDPACDVDVVPAAGLRSSPRHVLVSSLGFGGANCALLLSEGRR